MCKLGGAVVFFLICMINLMAKDVYDAIPTVVTTFVAIIAKIFIFIFLLELIYYTGQPVFGFN
jgi:NADH:ubiquinone oxidoreductase subunit 2 (subunit N)